MYLLLKQLYSLELRLTLRPLLANTKVVLPVIPVVNSLPTILIDRFLLI